MTLLGAAAAPRAPVSRARRAGIAFEGAVCPACSVAEADGDLVAGYERCQAARTSRSAHRRAGRDRATLTASRIARAQERSLHPATSYGRTSDRAPILPSEPAKSRAMFARCITHSSAASAANSHASPASPNHHSITGVATLAIKAESEE